MQAATGSVLRDLNGAAGELDRLLDSLNAYTRADTSLRAIAGRVAAAAERAPDIAIAAILLNQVGGRYAIRHCVDTAVLASLAAREAGMSADEILTVTAAALTMNVGMLRDIDSLHARASLLDSGERARIRRHPAEGAELLRCAGVDDKAWIDCVLQHHEAADGSGYPNGLCSGDIAASAALVGMADRYCACVGARNYRRSLLPPDALARLGADSASAAADASQVRLVQVFGTVLGAYPPGTLVRLDDGARGVVMARASSGAPLRVKVLRSADGAPAEALRAAPVIAAALHEDEARLRFSMQSVWGQMAAL